MILQNEIEILLCEYIEIPKNDCKKVPSLVFWVYKHSVFSTYKPPVTLILSWITHSQYACNIHPHLGRFHPPPAFASGYVKYDTSQTCSHEGRKGRGQSSPIFILFSYFSGYPDEIYSPNGHRFRYVSWASNVNKY